MSAPAETPLVSTLPSDVEELGDPVAQTDGRQLKPKKLHRLALGTTLVGAALLVVAACTAMTERHPVTSDGLADEEISLAPAKPFKQCGGSEWTGTTQCQAGCACIVQSQLYSQCEAPGGGMKCDSEKAAAEVAAAAERAEETKPQADEAQEAAQEAEKAAAKATVQANQAEGLAVQAINKGKAARQVLQAKKAEAAAAQKRADTATKNAHAKQKEHDIVEKEVKDITKIEALRQKGNCKAMYGKCQGSDVPAGKACCVEGCICTWKNQWYGECGPPKGKFQCDKAGELHENEVKKKAVKILAKQLADLNKRKDKSLAVAKKAKDEAELAQKAANEIGRKRVKAERVAKIKKNEAKKATSEAKSAKEMAVHAKHAVTYAQDAVKAWKEASKPAPAPAPKPKKHDKPKAKKTKHAKEKKADEEKEK